MKETQEEQNDLPHKYFFDVKLEKFSNSNADTNEEVASTVSLEGRVKMILSMKRTIKKEVSFNISFSIYFKLKF